MSDELKRNLTARAQDVDVGAADHRVLSVSFGVLTAADESVAGALAVSLAGNLPELGALATASFLDGFGIASLIGSIILLVAAVIVFRLMPRRFDLNQDH